MTDGTQERTQPGYWADYLPHWEKPIIEGLHDASCSPACKAITTCASEAWSRGWTAEEWRADLLSRHHEEEDVRLIVQAEECMRSSGLWLWNE